MFSSILSLVSGEGARKFLVVLGILFAIVTASCGFTYSKAKSYFIAQGDSRVLVEVKKTEEVTAKLAFLQQQFDKYVIEQQVKVRELELESAQQAIKAQSELMNYKAQLRKAQDSYEELLKQRGETPGVLSSAAVDTINADAELPK